MKPKFGINFVLVEASGFKPGLKLDFIVTFCIDYVLNRVLV